MPPLGRPIRRYGLDPYFGSVVLLLDGQGTNGGTAFTDLSPKHKTLTTVGNTQFSTTQVLQGTTSMKFDGTGDCIFINSNDSDFTYAGDFTVEVFSYWNGTTTGALQYDMIGSAVDTHTFRFGIRPSLGPALRNYAENAAAYDINGGSPSTVTWRHRAVTRSGSTVGLYENGTLVNSASYASALTCGDTFTIGAQDPSGATCWDGYIQAVRITNGAARYTGASFTPPTLPFPLF